MMTDLRLANALEIVISRQFEAERCSLGVEKCFDDPPNPSFPVADPIVLSHEQLLREVGGEVLCAVVVRSAVPVTSIEFEQRT